MSDPSTALADAGQGALEAPVTPEAPPPAAPETEPSVQSTEGAPEAQSDGGQDLIAPYLEGVDESIRDQVAERLERYRADADANFNRRFEEASTALQAFKQFAEDPAHLETPVALYDNLMQDPLGTLEWVAERFQSEMGRDLRAELQEKWKQATGETPPEGQPATDDADKPLTRKELEAWQREQQEETQRQEQQAQAKATTEGWLNEATQAAGLDLGEDDIAIKHAILTHAATLNNSVRDGKKAIAMAVEAVTNRLAPKTPKNPQPAPKVAAGGGPAAPNQPNWSDKSQRVEAMLSMLPKSGQDSEG